MTTLPRVISFLLILVVFLFAAVGLSFADVILSPIAEPNTLSFNPIDSAKKLGSFSFGDLLSSFSTSSAIPIATDSPILDASYSGTVSEEVITDFVNRLQLSSQEAKTALIAFLKKQSSDHASSQIQSVQNPELIPIPTLAAAVDAFITPIPYTEKTIAFLNNLTPSPFPTIEANIIASSPYVENEVLSALTLSPSITPIKSTYTIALLGDSMIDTLGPDVPHLRNLLQAQYPGKSFALLNYGFGSTDMDSGLYRLTNTTSYLGKTYPPLLSYKPDILVLESFGYNHWSGTLSDLNRQWLTIAKIIDTIKANSPTTQIVLAATVAPNPFIFGDGVLNWQSDKKWDSTTTTKAYLQNIINFATSQYYPLADAYHPSLTSEGHGNPRYINAGDHIHPSNEGKALFSQKVLDAIKNNNMIQ